MIVHQDDGVAYSERSWLEWATIVPLLQEAFDPPLFLLHLFRTMNESQGNLVEYSGTDTALIYSWAVPSSLPHQPPFEDHGHVQFETSVRYMLLRSVVATGYKRGGSLLLTNYNFQEINYPEISSSFDMDQNELYQGLSFEIFVNMWSSFLKFRDEFLKLKLVPKRFLFLLKLQCFPNLSQFFPFPQFLAAWHLCELRRS